MKMGIFFTSVFFILAFVGCGSQKSQHITPKDTDIVTVKYQAETTQGPLGKQFSSKDMEKLAPFLNNSLKDLDKNDQNTVINILINHIKSFDVVKLSMPILYLTFIKTGIEDKDECKKYLSELKDKNGIPNTFSDLKKFIDDGLITKLKESLIKLPQKIDDIVNDYDKLAAEGFSMNEIGKLDCDSTNEELNKASEAFYRLFL